MLHVQQIYFINRLTDLAAFVKHLNLAVEKLQGNLGGGAHSSGAAVVDR